MSEHTNNVLCVIVEEKCVCCHELFSITIYLITHVGSHHYDIFYGRPCFTGGFKIGRSYIRDRF